MFADFWTCAVLDGMPVDILSGIYLVLRGDGFALVQARRSEERMKLWRCKFE